MSDIRRFLCKKRKTDDTTVTPSFDHPNTDHQKEEEDEKSTLNSGANLLDIGLYLNANFHADDKVRLKLLRKPWTPSQMYNFKKDVKKMMALKRAFRSEAYSLPVTDLLSYREKTSMSSLCPVSAFGSARSTRIIYRLPLPKV